MDQTEATHTHRIRARSRYIRTHFIYKMKWWSFSMPEKTIISSGEMNNKITKATAAKKLETPSVISHYFCLCAAGLIKRWITPLNQYFAHLIVIHPMCARIRSAATSLEFSTHTYITIFENEAYRFKSFMKFGDSWHGFLCQRFCTYSHGFIHKTLFLVKSFLFSFSLF